MKKIYFLFGLLFILTSCSSVHVSTDYNDRIDFNSYKSFAFFKPGIDQVKISDDDKKIILRAIEAEMVVKKMTKSSNPELLINIFTKAQERVDVYQNFGWNYGPFWNNNFQTTSTEGELFIDILDAKTKQVIWQGKGSGYLTHNQNKKEERIREFVMEIMSKFPPK